MRPSLFHHAPSELSQDGFLAWLIAWADPACAPLDPKLHRAGRALLTVLFAKAHPSLSDLGEIKSIEVRRQYRRIDLFVVVNGTRALIVEDKVHAGLHGDQLARYLAEIEKERLRYRDGIHSVFLKTGSPTNAAKIRGDGYGYVSRHDLVSVLDGAMSAGVTNEILVDFTTHMHRLDAEFGLWATLPPREWPVAPGKPTSVARAWEGLFHAMLPSLPGAAWTYVANAAGGQFVLYLPGHEVTPPGPADGPKTWAYVQADSWHRLQVRIFTKAPDTPTRRHLRDAWTQRVLHNAPAPLALRPPDHRSIGETMAVTSRDRNVPWLLPNATGGVSEADTAQQLNDLDGWLRSVAIRPSHLRGSLA